MSIVIINKQENQFTAKLNESKNLYFFITGYPSVKNPPVLKPELDRFGESKFTCDFDRVTGYDVKYTVKFYLNEDVLREVTITRDDDFAILDENDFHEQLYGTAVSSYTCLSI